MTRAVIGATPQPKPHVYIVLLNWNGWTDTVECLESVFRLDYPEFTVIVCDNASSDGSIHQIEQWASGHLPASCKNPELAYLSQPPIPKSIPFISLSSPFDLEKRYPPGSLVLIQTGANLGFAGGNNVGIRFALSRGDCDYVWLLNNDTVVDPHALSAMIEMTEANQAMGICGSQLRDYAHPTEVHTMGGRRYSRWTGRSSPLSAANTPHLSTIPEAPDYVEGASMLIRSSLLREIGLLEEGYFLYFEELDLIERSKMKCCFGYAPDSIVFHKEGASIGSAKLRTNRSTLSEYYLARNRIIFTAKFYPVLLPPVFAAVMGSGIQRLLLGNPRSAKGVLRGLIAGLQDLSRINVMRQR